jgi:Tetratricopeptide repeat
MQAVEHGEESVRKSSTPSPNPNPLSNLGNTLLEAYDATGDLDYLDRSLNAQEQAAALTPQSSGVLPARLNNLGNTLTRLYERSRDLAYLDRAQANYQRSVSLTPPGAPLLASRLLNLGKASLERYLHTGSRRDRRASRNALLAACRNRSRSKTPR